MKANCMWQIVILSEVSSTCELTNALSSVCEWFHKALSFAFTCHL